MVSIETIPVSPSLLMRFHSLKCSHSEEMVPIALLLPFERMMKALYRKS
jgi:hypothetical protein